MVNEKKMKIEKKINEKNFNLSLNVYTFLPL